MHEKKIINLMIEPTNRCNLRCPTCFSHQDRRKKRDISLPEFKRIIDMNVSIIRNISLYNYGESLLNRSISQMVSYAKRKGVGFIKIDTNGIYLTKELIIALLKSGLDYLSISLDGATDEVYKQFRIKGEFTEVISNINTLINLRDSIKNNLKVEIQFIIMQHNEHQVGAIEKLARDLKVDVLRLKKLLVKNKKWNYLLPRDKEFNRYAGAKKYNSCSKPLEELVINCDGSIIPCCYIVGENIGKFKLGNIFKQTLKEIMASDRYTDFITKATTEKSILFCCTNCNEGNISLDYKVIRLNDR